MGVDEISNYLSKIPLYAAIAKVDPAMFSEIAKQMSEGYKIGLPRSDMIASLRPRVISLVRRSVVGAADELALQFNDINIEYLSGLQIKDAESCTAFAVGTSKYARQRIDFASEFPQIADRELKLYAKIILSGYNGRRQVPRLDDIQKSFSWVAASLLERVGKADYETFVKGDAEPTEFVGFCRASVEFFKIILLLPKTERVGILRYLYSQLDPAAVVSSANSGPSVRGTTQPATSTDHRRVEVTSLEKRDESFRVTSVDGNFAIEFPSEPKFQKHHGTTQTGLPYDEYAWTLEQGGRFWSVSCQVYPASTTWDHNRAIKGVLDSAKGRLIRQSTITQAGVSGREVFVEANGYIFRQRIFYRGGRAYQLLYVGPPGSELNTDVDVFMKSFDIL
jgi:hypothetical protein